MLIPDVISFKLLKIFSENLDMSTRHSFISSLLQGRRPKIDQFKHFLLGSDIYFKSGLQGVWLVR